MAPDPPASRTPTPPELDGAPLLLPLVGGAATPELEPLVDALPLLALVPPLLPPLPLVLVGDGAALFIPPLPAVLAGGVVDVDGGGLLPQANIFRAVKDNNARQSSLYLPPGPD
jgi:hypothetical protein